MPLSLLSSPSPSSLDSAALPAAAIDGLYIHVPFCFHKCHYCDFYSITRQTDERMARYVDLTLAEAARWGRLRDVQPRTVFFGGGTPSLLPPREMARLIAGLRERLDLSAIDEWTVEVNPATAQEDYLALLREAGVDRVSFGAQSFHPGELATLERHHEPAEVAHSVSAARAAGFRRINLDLIYAIPGQTEASWAASLDTAIGMGTPHVSAYALTYEPNTPMAVRKRLGHFLAAPEELELAMMRHARRRLAEAGLQAYEISNYAIPGEECRHNLMYWSGGNYLGLGPSAASHVSGWRWRNRPHLGEWESAVAAGGWPACDVERLSPARRAGERAMLALRLSGGVVFADFERSTGFDAREMFASCLSRYVSVGLLTLDVRSIRLTESGLPVADAIAAEFLAEASDKS